MPLLQFRNMAVDQTYSSWKAYFEGLATSNVLIQHDSANTKNKRFYFSTLEAFILDQKSHLPKELDPTNCFIHLIEPQSEIGIQKKETWQVVFFVMSAYTRGDEAQYEQAKNTADVCTNQIISKMINDSVNNHPLFKRSFDTAKGLRKTPYSVSGHQQYVGNQISFSIIAPFDYCFNSQDWL